MQKCLTLNHHDRVRHFPLVVQWRVKEGSMERNGEICFYKGMLTGLNRIENVKGNMIC